MTKDKSKYTCDGCCFKTNSDVEFKRHNRDEHDTTTNSTSPKPKKRKKDSEDEQMETTESNANIIDVEDLTKEGEVFWNDARGAKIVRSVGSDSEEEVILQRRSDFQDNKVKMKEAKLKEEEERYQKKKENDVIERELKCKENSVNKKAEKKKSKTQKKNQKRKDQTLQKLKPFLRELPPAVRKLLGDRFLSFPVEGDGACGPRSFAAWIFEDPTLCPYLARNINLNFIKQWDYWANKFT